MQYFKGKKINFSKTYRLASLQRAKTFYTQINAKQKNEKNTQKSVFSRIWLFNVDYELLDAK